MSLRASLTSVWASPSDVLAQWRLEARFTPAPDRTAADAGHAQWLRALERSRNWER